MATRDFLNTDGLTVEQIRLDELTPDPHNAKLHPDGQVEQICESIRRFGNLDPIGVWGPENVIVEGHGRYLALQRLGAETAPCIRLDQLTDEERRAYALVHNQTTLNSGWDPEALEYDLSSISFDMSAFDFQVPETEAAEDPDEDPDADPDEESEEYQAFTEKFKRKKTTDDCYTPPQIYEAVAAWVADTYNLDPGSFLRPFRPDGDYENDTYPEGCVVVDNPPFSILAEILRFYSARGIRFFLFAPALTPFSSAATTATVLGCGVTVTYDNGAEVNTSFVTNLEPPEIRARSAPELYQVVKAANDAVLAATHAELPTYSYPDEVLTAAMLNRYAKYGVAYGVERSETAPTDALDAQRAAGKAIFGKGFLLSRTAAAERAAAERAAAERAAATRWQLSEREQALVDSLGGDSHGGQPSS